jgi:hypothetical protein
LKDKKAQGNYLAIIISLVLIVVLILLIIWGFSQNAFVPLKEKFAGMYNSVLVLLGIKPEPYKEPVDDLHVKAVILGKERTILLNDGEGRCTVDIEELGKFGLDFNEDSPEFVYYFDFLNPAVKDPWYTPSAVKDLPFSKWYSAEALNQMLKPTILNSDRWISFLKENAAGNKRQEFENAIKNLKIDVDGKKYPVKMNSKQLEIDMGSKKYYYSIEESSDLNGKSFPSPVLSGPYSSDFEREEIIKALNNLKIALYGKVYPLVYEKRTDLVYNGENYVFSVKTDFYEMIAGYHYFDTLNPPQEKFIFDSRFIGDEDSLGNSIQEINKALKDNCT